MESYFWFHKDAVYLSNGLLAVMSTCKGAEYMKTKDRNKLFDKRNHTVKAICQKANKTSVLKFIENIYKDGYSFTKYRYIREERLDIMKAVRIIEHHLIKYLYKKHLLEFSMDFEDMRLD